MRESCVFLLLFCVVLFSFLAPVASDLQGTILLSQMLTFTAI